MKAYSLQEVKTPLQAEQRDNLVPQSEEVVVTLKAASLNRRDYWITQGMYPGLHFPIILGSDGAGFVSSIGDQVNSSWLEKEVIINPGMNWGDDESHQSSDFTILGLPNDGTFASEVVVPVDQLHPKPGYLNWQQAAALPLAGVTAYRALFTQGKFKPDQSVLISGVGGGVASYALQFAIAIGAKVWVTSSSDDKIKKSIELGAEGGFNYKSNDWVKFAAKEMDAPNLIIDSAGGSGYQNLITLAAAGGSIVNYGATTGPPEKLDLFKVFWNQLNLIGSTMGSPADFEAMLSLIEKHKIAPVIDKVLSLTEVNQGLEMMKSSSQFGKIVLSNAD